MAVFTSIDVKGATEHNLKDVDIAVDRGAITVVTGVSGSGKSSLAFDTILAESQRRFFYTLSHYSRQFLDLGNRPAVRSVTGLSPAIALAQNETAPSRRATLGSLTDISELLAVMFARFGVQYCPTHGLPTGSMTKDDILSHIVSGGMGQSIALVIQEAESKKGVFRAQLTQCVTRGFTKAWIDGQVMDLDPLPELAREEKHTIKVLVDLVKVKETGNDRLSRGVDTVLELGGGFGEWVPVDAKGKWNVDEVHSFSTKGGCPTCGYSWPRLDSRYFNANSLGRCETCDGYGVPDAQEYADGGEDVDANDAFMDQPCAPCFGTGVQPDAAAIKLGGLTIHELLTLPLDRVLAKVAAVAKQPQIKANPAFERVWSEVKAGLERLVAMRLGYLSLARRVRSLSGGEAQRVKLAGILSENLRGILYVLDEPSQGLHQTELQNVIASLKQLRDEGNTIIVVDHDETMMRSADWIIDLGPGGGAGGGNILARFTPKTAGQFADVSRTASWLSRKPVERKRKVVDRVSGTFLEITKPTLHNLKLPKVRVPLEAMTVVTGVSGAGKSSLVLGVIFPNLLDVMQETGGAAASNGSQAAKLKKKKTANTKSAKPQWRYCTEFKGWDNLTSVQLIDRRPVAKSSVSMPATYLDITGDLRDLYASLPDAQVAGLTAKAFSLHLEGGRCPECKGRGEINLSMRFLADARIQCPVCRGKRFRNHVLDVKFNGLNMSEVLNLSIDEAVAHFGNHRRIVHKLAPAQRMGLGYLKLGQPSASLSGGEAQRLKMVPFFTKRMGAGTVLILDEPTTGLHFEDVERLIAVMRELVDNGATLIVVEHNDEVLRSADWQIDIGPGSAFDGGDLMYEGSPDRTAPRKKA